MSTSGAELFVPGTITITFFTGPENPPHHCDFTPCWSRTLAGSPSVLARLATMRRHPLAAYFVLAYAITWAFGARTLSAAGKPEGPTFAVPSTPHVR